MTSGTIDGRYYENIPTPEEWGNLMLQREADIAAMKLALEALYWASASQDFAESGIARQGYLRVMVPAIDALKERLLQE